jgi:hypothetical protein
VGDCFKNAVQSIMNMNILLSLGSEAVKERETPQFVHKTCVPFRSESLRSKERLAIGRPLNSLLGGKDLTFVRSKRLQTFLSMYKMKGTPNVPRSN